MKHTSTLRLAAFFAIFSFAFVAGTGKAQTGTIASSEGDKTSLEQNVYGFGTNFSLMSGVGLSFREHFKHSPFSYMLTGYVFKDKSGATYDYGVELQYDIYMKEFTRFYGFAGASYFYNGARQSQFDPIVGQLNIAEYNQLDGPQRVGAGIGFETAIGYSVSLYANLSLTSFQPVGDLLIYPYGGIMIYFK